jgi:hypothetical protein
MHHPIQVCQTKFVKFSFRFSLVAGMRLREQCLRAEIAQGASDAS